MRRREGSGGGGSATQPVGDHPAGSPACIQALTAPGTVPRAGRGSGRLLPQAHLAGWALHLKAGALMLPWVATRNTQGCSSQAGLVVMGCPQGSGLF